MTPRIGWTYSLNQAEWLALDPWESFTTLLSWHPDIIRLGVHWSETEVSSGKYDFSRIERLLKMCTDAKQKVLLTVGMKAPRWPEFYFPEHITPNPHDPETQAAALTFLKQSVRHLQKFDCISHWQVENEPFDPSGPDNHVIPDDFLCQECELVRTLDSRPIVVNLWGNDVLARGRWPRANTLADITGLDLYYKQHLFSALGKDLYRGPSQSNTALARAINQFHKPVWIIELQAEPWEKDGPSFRQENPPSMNLAHLEKNLDRALKLPVECILLWGAEYWLWKKETSLPQRIAARQQAASALH
ncbi:hypothetical protein LRY65_01740 [Candidatus Woesebacteria bacterium]|nr:hypothetical protein [Candidatus Woesebacteria bacterium]MCD8526913.1 hypothetical protein [Candidatus Woesebacteria bacterium]MCD8546062.1 hypothetical protein [Candidatus Woesebacteria bacterium]